MLSHPSQTSSRERPSLVLTLGPSGERGPAREPRAIPLILWFKSLLPQTFPGHLGQPPPLCAPVLPPCRPDGAGRGHCCAPWLGGAMPEGPCCGEQTRRAGVAPPSGAPAAVLPPAAGRARSRPLPPWACFVPSTSLHSRMRVPTADPAVAQCLELADWACTQTQVQPLTPRLLPPSNLPTSQPQGLSTSTHPDWQAVPTASGPPTCQL